MTKIKTKGRFGGRPQVLRDMITRNIVLEQDLEGEIEDMAVREGISFSEKVRQVLYDEVERKKEIAPNSIGVCFRPPEIRQSNLFEFILEADNLLEFTGCKQWIDKLRDIEKDRLTVIGNTGLAIHRAVRTITTGVYSR